MKILKSLGVLGAIWLLPLGATASESEDAAVLAILKPVADAVLHGDFVAGIQVMYEPLAEELGGKPRLIASVGTLKRQLEDQNLKIVRQEFVPPFRFVQGGQRRYVIVPTLTEMQTPKELMRLRSFQLGVEVSPGVWQFVDGVQVTPAVRAKHFSDLPAAEKFPESRRETLPLPVGSAR